MKIRCVAPVRSASYPDRIAEGFTVGHEYEVEVSDSGRKWSVIDDDQEWWLVRRPLEDGGSTWFDKYFIVIEDYNDAWDRAMGLL